MKGVQPFVADLSRNDEISRIIKPLTILKLNLYWVRHFSSLYLSQAFSRIAVHPESLVYRIISNLINVGVVPP